MYKVYRTIDGEQWIYGVYDEYSKALEVANYLRELDSDTPVTITEG